MRSEKEMFAKILDFAKRNDRIRAVHMNGSRANSKVTPDRFQDYDIVYTVTDIAHFRNDKSWICEFGEIAVMQEPDDSALFPPEHDPASRYAFLMQFCDGVRIDLSFQSIAFTKSTYGQDSLTIPLLDKDRLLPPIAPSSDRSYWVKKPQENEYLACCNEFWWVSPYVAKGLRRGELLYAFDCLDGSVRPMLFKMLSWYVGIETNFSESVGKSGKYLQKYLPEVWWKKLLSTYSRAEAEEVWTSLFSMCSLFEEASVSVGESLGFRIPYEESHQALDFLKKVFRHEIP